jgi:hypothetical protein
LGDGFGVKAKKKRQARADCVRPSRAPTSVYVCYVGSKNSTLVFMAWLANLTLVFMAWLANLTLVFMAWVSQCFYQPTMTWFHNKISKKNMFISNCLQIQNLTCIFPYFVQMKQMKVHSTIVSKGQHI